MSATSFLVLLLSLHLDLHATTTPSKALRSSTTKIPITGRLSETQTEIGSMEKEKRNGYGTACAVVASIISVLMGYDTGVMSGAMLFIKEELKTSSSQIGILAGILNIAAVFGSLMAGRTSDAVGRRYTIVIASAIFFLGSALMGLAPNYAMLVSGRCVAGIGVGFALLVAPVYSAEISSPSNRGSLASLPEICISSGILLGYISNYLLAKLPLRYGWRTMLGLTALPSMILGMAILTMPESPRWLAMKGRLGEAREVLLKISNTPEEADKRMQEIKSVVGGDDGVTSETSTRKSVWRDLYLKPTPAVRRIVIATFGIHFFQHLTGIEAIILYSPSIFDVAGIHDKNSKLAATIGVGVAKICFIFLAIYLIDRFGRRPLLLTSTTGAIVTLSIVGAGLTSIHQTGHAAPWLEALCVAMVICYISFFSIGLGPVTWVYTSEFFPLRLRAQGASVCVAANRLMNAIISTLFPILRDAITIGGVFFMFAGMALLAWVFFFVMLPETKLKPMEEVQELFENGTFPGLAKRRASPDVEG